METVEVLHFQEYGLCRRPVIYFLSQIRKAKHRIIAVTYLASEFLSCKCFVFAACSGRKYVKSARCVTLVLQPLGAAHNLKAPGIAGGWLLR